MSRGFIDRLKMKWRLRHSHYSYPQELAAHYVREWARMHSRELGQEADSWLSSFNGRLDETNPIFMMTYRGQDKSGAMFDADASRLGAFAVRWIVKHATYEDGYRSPGELMNLLLLYVHKRENYERDYDKDDYPLWPHAQEDMAVQAILKGIIDEYGSCEVLGEFNSKYSDPASAIMFEFKKFVEQQYRVRDFKQRYANSDRDPKWTKATSAATSTSPNHAAR